MMVLEFFIWGAWLPLIWGYMGADGLKFTDMQITWVGSAFAIASVVGIFFSNQFADRNFAAEKFLAFSHLVGGLAMLGLGFVHSFGAFFLLQLALAVIWDAYQTSHFREEERADALLTEHAAILVAHPWFENLILFLILISSVNLALDEPRLARLHDVLGVVVDGMPPAVQESLSASIPFPARLGKPEEFAATAAFILQNRYLNGETLRLDGAVRVRPGAQIRKHRRPRWLSFFPWPDRRCRAASSGCWGRSPTAPSARMP